MSNSIFSNFTNLYSLSKTLKFELKATEMTKGNLDFTKDKDRTEHYKNIKLLFDQLHRRFIDQALTLYSKTNTDYNEFLRVYTEFLRLRKIKKDHKAEFEAITKEFENLKLMLRKRIVDYFDKCGDDFELEYNDIFKNHWIAVGKDITKFKPILKDKRLKVLTEAGILEVLKYMVQDEQLKIDGKTKEEVKNGIEFFDGFFTYFGPFNQTRENLYKADGTATAIATRIIDQNLVRFCDNIKLNEELKMKNEEFYQIFELDFFNQSINQSKLDDYNTELGNYKSWINSQNQNSDKGSVKSNFKNLYKIMLSEMTTIFKEETAESCVEILKEVYKDQNQYLPQIQANYQMIWDNSDNNEFLEKIFIKKEELAKLSTRFFGGNNWSLLEIGIKNTGFGKFKEGKIKLQDFVPITAIKDSFEGNFVQTKKKQSTLEESLAGSIAGDLFKDSLMNESQKSRTDLWKVFVEIWQNEFQKQIDENIKYNEIAKTQLLELPKYTALQETSFALEIEEKSTIKKVVQTQSNIAKLWLDSCMSLWQAVRMFEITKKDENKYDDYEIHHEFYELVRNFANEYPLSKSYDKIRNFSTKKPFSEDEVRIQFNKPNLLNGWSVGQEEGKQGVLLRIENKIWLGVLNNNQLFPKKENKINPIYNADGNCQRLMMTNLKFQTLAGKGFISQFGKKYSEMEEMEAMQKLQLFIQSNYIQKYPQLQPALEKFDTKKDFDAKIMEIIPECYTTYFENIDHQILLEAEKENKILLFEICDRDLYKNKIGKNLQTVLFESIFSPENLDNPVIGVAAYAKIFLRNLTKELKRKPIITKVNKITPNSNAIELKRYTEDRLTFHLPITININSDNHLKKKTKEFNEQFNTNNSNFNRLGIDRGENNLLYYCLTSPTGIILDQGSLNSFNGVDYEKLLNQKQEDRKTAKDKWAAIGNIKDLKAGYLSLAVGKIIRLAINNNSLINLENLNYGFKKSRTIKFEKSVYQKFEVALATKLQHVVLKEKQPHELGGTLNGLQLCPPLDITKLDTASEWGIIKYVSASYTSRICPLTGWHKTKYLKKTEDIKNTFNPDADNNYIKIAFDLKYKCYTFDDRSGNGLIYAHKGLVRNIYNPKEKDFDLRSKEINGEEIHTNLEKILSKFKLNNGEFDQTEMWANLGDKDWSNLNYNFDVVCSIRVKQKGVNGEKIDRIQSPILCTPTNCIFPKVKSSFEPVFFDTAQPELDRIIKILGLEYKTIVESDGTTTRICPLPQDGDANGSYHIAIK